jgi:hypothetical protein
MSQIKQLFDLKLLKKRQTRAKKIGFVDFLDKAITRQASDRLIQINKNFLKPAIIGGKADFWAKELNMSEALLIDDNEFLGLKEKSHDLIIHALSLHWYNDPIGQLIQIRKALVEDGLMLAFLFGGDTLMELRSSFNQAESLCENGISPRVAPMGDLRDLGSLLSRAGLNLNVADISNFVVSYDNPLKLLYDLRAMGETNIMLGRRKTMLNRKTFYKVLDIYSKNFVSNDDKDRIKATFEVVCLTGWAHSENQQKPLARGSASNHLSEILRVEGF